MESSLDFSGALLFEKKKETAVDILSLIHIFWNPHEVKLTDWLKEGENHIRIVVTGNLANRYGNAEVYYGLL